MSNLRAKLDEIRGGAGGGRKTGADFWRPKDTGKYALRLYRFTDASSQTQELFRDTIVHFTGDGPPVPCLGNACQVCSVVNTLSAAGDDDSKERARRLRASRRMVFIVVLQSDPTGFKIWEASEGVGKQLLTAVAKAGGYMGKWPNETEMDEFFLCLQKGIPSVCGPAGKDIVLTYDKKAVPRDMYTVDLKPFENTTLPFAEDTGVPDPKAIRERIDAAKAKKDRT